MSARWLVLVLVASAVPVALADQVPPDAPPEQSEPVDSSSPDPNGSDSDVAGGEADSTAGDDSGPADGSDDVHSDEGDTALPEKDSDTSGAEPPPGAAGNESADRGEIQPAIARPSEPTIGILLTNWVNVPEATATELSRELAAALTETLRVRARAGVARDVYLASELPTNCLATPRCIKRLHNRVGTDQLYLVTVVRIAQLIRMDVSQVEPLAGTVRPVTVVSVEDRKGIRAQFRAQASTIVPGISARPRPVSVQRPERLVVKYVREPRGRHVTTGVYLAGSMAVATGLGAVVTGLFANDLYGDLEDAGCRDNPCDSIPELADDRDSLRALTITTDVLIGVSVGAAVVAGYLYWTSDEPGAGDRDLPVSLQASGNGAAITFGGRF